MAQVPRRYLQSPPTASPAPSWPADTPCTLIQEGSRLTLAHRSGPGTDVALPSWRTGMRRGRWSPQGHRRRVPGREDKRCSPSLRLCPVCGPLPLRAPRGHRAGLLSLRACRRPVHPALPRKPCSPSPPQEPPEHLCPRHQRVWGRVAQPLSVGFTAAATATPHPGS